MPKQETSVQLSGLYFGQEIEKMAARPASGDNGLEFPFKQFISCQGQDPKFEVCEDCFLNWWEPAGRGCKDEVKRYRHALLSRLVYREMCKRFPGLEDLACLYVPFVKDRGRDWLVHQGRVDPSQKKKMEYQHAFNINQRRYRQNNRGSQLNGSTGPIIPASAGSSDYGSPHSGSEGKKPLYGTTCGLSSTDIDIAWTGSGGYPADESTSNTPCSPESLDSFTTSNLSEFPAAYYIPIEHSAIVLPSHPDWLKRQ